MSVVTRSVFADVHRRAAWPQLFNRLIHELPPASLRLLSESLNTRNLPADALCFSSGTPVDDVYFPICGTISLTSMTRNGDNFRTAMIGKEGAAGLQSALSARDALTHAVVQTAGTFQTISAQRLRTLASRDAAIKDWIFDYTERTWQEALQMTMCNAVHDASSRLCRCLLQAADQLGSEQLPFTQEMLSEMLGVRRTTITEQAQELQRLDLISYSRGKIALLDREELEKHACECYQILRSDHTIGVAQMQAPIPQSPKSLKSQRRDAAMELPS